MEIFDTQFLHELKQFFTLPVEVGCVEADACIFLYLPISNGCVMGINNIGTQDVESIITREKYWAYFTCLGKNGLKNIYMVHQGDYIERGLMDKPVFFVPYSLIRNKDVIQEYFCKELMRAINEIAFEGGGHLKMHKVKSSFVLKSYVNGPKKVGVLFL